MPCTVPFAVAPVQGEAARVALGFQSGQAGMAGSKAWASTPTLRKAPAARRRTSAKSRASDESPPISTATLPSACGSGLAPSGTVFLRSNCSYMLPCKREQLFIL